MPPRLRIQQLPLPLWRARPWASTGCHTHLPVTGERCLHSTTQIIERQPLPEPIVPFKISTPPSSQPPPQPRIVPRPSRPLGVHSPQYDLKRTPAPPSPSHDKRRSPLTLTSSLRSHLPQLASQPPFYATIHIHGKPYLVTAGDTVRLPFLMHGVMPGDVLRLDRATTIGSRDWTLLGRQSSNTTGEADVQTGTVEPIIGKTEGLEHTPHPRSSTSEAGKEAGLKKKGPPAYLDDRLFVCRATVMGTESEPLRVKEVTKRRQRHVKHIKSKHRYTIIRVSEITPKILEEVDAESGEVRS